MADTETSDRTKPSSKRRVYLSIGIVGVLALIVVVLGVIAYSKLSSARDDLNQASANASELQSALTSGKQVAAAQALAQMQGNVRSADSTLHSAVLSIAASTPIFGKNIDAVRTVTSAAAKVANDGLPPLVKVADKFNAKTFNPKDGKFNVAALTELTPSLAEATKALAAADAQIRSINASTLLGQLRKPVRDAQDKIRGAASIASRATVASRVVPTMLDGKHTYLLTFQNNAEIRATGGMPGSYAGLVVDNGSIQLVGQDAGGDLSNLSKDALPITAEENQLFTNQMVRDFRDVNFTPDFPRSAQIAAAIVRQKNGTDVDGVISLDPVTLSYLLKGIGPVVLNDGTRLTSDNAVQVLLNGVYLKYPDGAAQDAFFTGATEKIFDKVIAGAGDPTTVLKALTKATNERRVSIWAKDPAVNKEIAGTPLAHELPVRNGVRPSIGFYLNDSTGAKMQYYLKTAVTGTSTKCSDAGAQTYQTEMALTSSAPADSASLPVSIRGPGYGAAPGSMLMNLYVYGPAGGKIDSVSFDGKKTDFFTAGTHQGRPVALVTVQVDPGQTVKVGATIASAPGQKGSTTVDATPSITPGPSTQTWRSSC